MPSRTRIRNSGSFCLDIAAGDAFPLFTAAGEKLWVPGWEPEILGSPDQKPGLVFLTTSEDCQTIWTVIESNQPQLRHTYSRVTPGSHAGTVQVQLSEEGAGSRVTVTYDLTALPGARSDALANYGDSQFTAMLSEWRSLINKAQMVGRLSPNAP